MKRLSPYIGRRWRTLKTVIYWIFRKEPPKKRDPIPRKQREAAVTRFILGFSDQQLATGLAILIAFLANRCRMTLYELQVVFSLAWFSATIHLATLKVLREYFFDNAVVRNWRIIGIFTFSGLLLFTMSVLIRGLDGYYLENEINAATPVACIIDGRTRPNGYEALFVFIDVAIITFLLTQYAVFTYHLFIDPRENTGKNISITRASLTKAARKSSQYLPQSMQDLIRNSDIMDYFLLQYRSRISVRHGPGAVRTYQHSFASYLPELLFSFAYGAAQAIKTVWFSGTKTSDDVRRMGFGQVCALALLAIPALTACEIYNGERPSILTSRHVRD